jgi:Protein of unknown function (DUF2934)
MKQRSAQKNPKKKSITTQEKPSDVSTNGTWHRIATIAYELYEHRGRPDGHDLDDWLNAEAIVNGTAR